MTNDQNQPSIASTPEEFYARVPEQDRTVVQGFVDSMKGLDAVVYACGSTVTGTQHEGSDIDLLVDTRDVKFPDTVHTHVIGISKNVYATQSVGFRYLERQRMHVDHPPYEQ